MRKLLDLKALIFAMTFVSFIGRRGVGSSIFVRAFCPVASASSLRLSGIVNDSQLFSSLERDSEGRRTRRRPEDAVAREDSNGTSWGGLSRNTKGLDGGGWDDYDADRDTWNPEYTPRPRAERHASRGGRRGRGGGGRGGGQRDFRQSSRNAGGNLRRSGSRSDASSENKGRAINMNGLESAGFVHLYGLSSILNALKANRRDFTADQERFSSWTDEDEEKNATIEREPPKPQAQFKPYLFVQERRSSTRKGQKASDAESVLDLAEELGLPVAEVDKGVLNTLSGNRPHQGFVLRCGKLYFESMSRIPLRGEGAPSLWLVLDEVVDPQNLGALLRSAFFLGGGEDLGVLVCSKNSAPPTPVVSASSAGALEILTVHSTTNLPRTLNQAKEDGFRIIGASSSVPSTSSSLIGGDDEVPPLYDLQDLPVSTEDDDRPILLVLGSEGHGLRTLVAKACTEFVRIPSGSDGSSDTSVDSLNVSVTGGILLWHLLSRK